MITLKTIIDKLSNTLQNYTWETLYIAENETIETKETLFHIKFDNMNKSTKILTLTSGMHISYKFHFWENEKPLQKSIKQIDGIEIAGRFTLSKFVEVYYCGSSHKCYKIVEYVNDIYTLNSEYILVEERDKNE